MLDIIYLLDNSLPKGTLSVNVELTKYLFMVFLGVND
jgi:hypothetical protein